MTSSGGTVLGFYDNQDRLTQYGTATYAFTSNGDLQSTTTGGQTTMYQYDVLGNLKSVVGPTGFTIEYVVDGQNRRIGKKVNGVLTQGFLYQNQLNPCPVRWSNVFTFQQDEVSTGRTLVDIL